LEEDRQHEQYEEVVSLGMYRSGFGGRGSGRASYGSRCFILEIYQLWVSHLSASHDPTFIATDKRF
jgi:hypothetical protein